MKSSRSYGSLLIAVTLLGGGCRDSEVASYRIPKDSEPTAPMEMAENAPIERASSSMSDASVASATGSSLIWMAPVGWESKPASAMRRGSYLIKGEGSEEADLSITVFPGAVGGELANINRWRAQLALPPIQESDLNAAVTRTTTPDFTFTIVDCSSTDANPRRILGAMTPFKGAMWFFKVSGPDLLVASIKPAFLEFLNSVKSPPPGPR